MWKSKQKKRAVRNSGKTLRKPTFEACENRQLMAADLVGAADMVASTELAQVRQLDISNGFFQAADTESSSSSSSGSGTGSVVKPELYLEVHAQDKWGNTMSHEEWMDYKLQVALGGGDPHDFYEGGFDPDRPHIWG